MTSQTPPYPYFNGITYNPSFFSSSSSSTSSGGLTQTQANLLYLRKTTADTASFLETFSGGISSSAIDALSSSSSLDIGTDTARSGSVNIGTGVGSLGGINIGALTNTTTINGILVGQNGCLAGRTNYLSINTSTLPQNLPSNINIFLFIYFTGSTALKTYNMTSATNIGQKILMKNGSSVSVNIAFPVGAGIYLFTDVATNFASVFYTLKTTEVLDMYWNGTNWVQTAASNTMPELTTTGFVSVGGSLTANSDFNMGQIGSRLLLNGSYGTGGQYFTSQGGNAPVWSDPYFIGTATSDLNMGDYNISTTTGNINLGAGGVLKLGGSSGVAGQYLVSGGTGTPTWVSSTSTWNGTATSALNMTTYDITTTTGSLNIGTGGFIKLNSSVGTSGQYLSSTGPSTSPAWATLPASTWVGTATSSLNMNSNAITAA